MAIVHITMNTKISGLQTLLPQDVELNMLAIELFYYACVIRERHGSGAYPVNDIGASVTVDSITFSNPFDIWVYLKTVPLGIAKEVLDRTVYHNSESRRRSAEAGRAEQAEISDKLDNLRKANAIRDELIASGMDGDRVTELLGKILIDQNATIEVHAGDHRRRPSSRLTM